MCIHAGALRLSSILHTIASFITIIGVVVCVCPVNIIIQLSHYNYTCTCTLKKQSILSCFIYTHRREVGVADDRWDCVVGLPVGQSLNHSVITTALLEIDGIAVSSINSEYYL